MAYKRYEKDKDSGIEWIGDIPEHWQTSKVKYELVNLDNKRIPLSSEERGGLEKVYDYYGASGVIDKVDKYIFDEDLILIGEDGANLITRSSKLAFIAKGKYWVNNHAHILKPNKGNDLEYFANQLELNDYTNLISGSAQPKLTQENLAGVNLVIPPKKEQYIITCYLNKKITEIDGLIQDKENLIGFLKEQRQAIITEAVTKGLDKNVSMKDSGVEYIGYIPSAWEVKKLRYLGNLQNGISKSAEYFGKGYPFVSYGDIYKNNSIPIDISGKVESNENERRLYSVDEGDVFFTRTSETIEEIGFASTCLYAVENATFAGFLIRFRPKNNVLAKGFSKYYFRSTMHRRFFVKEMNIVTRASLSQELLKQLPVIIPPIDEQERIANYLDNKTFEIDSLINDVKDGINNLKEYKQSLISEVVTGKINILGE